MNAVLKEAYSDLNEKIIEETDQALLSGANLLDELLNECIDFKALSYLLLNNSQFHSSALMNMPYALENATFDYSKEPFTLQESKKSRIFLSKKVKRTSRGTEKCSTNKALKNNKLVYCHSDFSTKESKNVSDEHLPLSQESFLTANPSLPSSTAKPSLQRKNRGSIYRGVSRNGNQWQVLIMINKKKRYIGSYSNELEAAKAYDIVALQNHKRKAKTNFYYPEEERRGIISKFVTGK